MPSISEQTPIIADQTQVASAYICWDPDNDSPEVMAESIENTRAPHRATSRFSAQVEKRQEELSLLIKEEAIHDLQENKKEAEDKIQELQSAHNNVRDEAEPVDRDLAEVRAINEPLEQKFIEAEIMLFELTQHKGKIDKLALLRQEIAVAKAKPEVFENRIKILVLEETRRKKTERAQELSKAQEAATNAVSTKEIEIQLLQSEVDQERAAYAAKWGYEFTANFENGDSKINGDTKVNEVVKAIGLTKHVNEPSSIQPENLEYEAMKFKLEAAEHEVLRQAKEIELFKMVNPVNDDIEHDNVVFENASVHSENGTKVQATMTNLLKENQILKTRIEKMAPLADVGFFTRARAVELGLKEVRHRKGNNLRLMNEDLLEKGLAASRLWNAKADAAMFLSARYENCRTQAEFLDLYGVSVNPVWDHRNFSYFQNMITWKVDVANNYSKINHAAFNEAYDKLFKAIMPNFEIDSDNAIDSDAELHEAYDFLKNEYTAAKQASEQSFKNQRSSNNGFYSHSRPGVPLRASPSLTKY